MIMLLVKTHHMVLETEGDVEEDAGQEGEGDVDLGILECVQSVEMCGSVDGDVPVDGHADDDVDRAGHEGVDERQFQVCLVDGGGVAASSKTMRDIVESRNSSDEDAEVGDSKTYQVEVHHTLQVGLVEHHQAQQVAHHPHPHHHVSHYGVGHKLYLFNSFF